jgi:hypothetical protein
MCWYNWKGTGFSSCSHSSEEFPMCVTISYSIKKPLCNMQGLQIHHHSSMCLCGKINSHYYGITGTANKLMSSYIKIDIREQ